LFLNGIHSPTWDFIFEWITGRAIWFPIIIVPLILSASKHKWKTLYFFLFMTLLFTMSEQISVQLFKNVFERLRPCHNETISSLVHIINGHCGGQYGFVSSHATNSFALAMFISLFLRNHYRFIFPILLFWAVSVSYSRIYVGVHYPADILGGAILGTVIALFVYHLMKYINNRFNLKIDMS